MCWKDKHSMMLSKRKVFVTKQTIDSFKVKSSEIKLNCFKNVRE